jgi:hypothetical protein
MFLWIKLVGFATCNFPDAKESKSFFFLNSTISYISLLILLGPLETIKLQTEVIRDEVFPSKNRIWKES